MTCQRCGVQHHRGCPFDDKPRLCATCCRPFKAIRKIKARWARDSRVTCGQGECLRKYCERCGVSHYRRCPFDDRPCQCPICSRPFKAIRKVKGRWARENRATCGDYECIRKYLALYKRSHESYQTMGRKGGRTAAENESKRMDKELEEQLGHPPTESEKLAYDLGWFHTLRRRQRHDTKTPQPQ